MIDDARAFESGAPAFDARAAIIETSHDALPFRIDHGAYEQAEYNEKVQQREAMALE